MREVIEETVETVDGPCGRCGTSLKRGVNEKLALRIVILHCFFFANGNEF
jgi:hypothetical protein